MLRARIELQKGNSPLSFRPFLNPLIRKIPKLHQTQTPNFRMVTQSGSSKRPTCPSCSKPTRFCLCNRLRTPTLNNSTRVTILQHSLEKKHPLNSTRIATIGLKHVDVVNVCDVNFQARFFIRLLNRSCGVDRAKLDEDSHLLDEMPSAGENDEFVGRSNLGNTKSVASDIDSDGQVTERSAAILAAESEVIIDRDFMDGFVRRKVDLRGSAFEFTMGKYGAITFFNNCFIAPDKCEQMKLDQLLASSIAARGTRKGFVVKKIGTMLLEGSNEYEEIEEFEVAVPPGSVLLFPSERSVDVKAVNFEVKNLIVLDGTWAKAKRMYNENPWLRLLPHIKLDLDKLSLYGEVRHQPRAGYLSTIESIVYAMKALGEDSEGFDGLLDVFESMVGDQRQCKNERLSKASEKID